MPHSPTRFFRRASLALAVLALTALPLGAAAETAPLDALYITNYEDFWHDYGEQTRLTEDVLPLYANVSVTAVGKSAEDAIELMRTADFALGYDVVIYNICLADNEDYEMVDNIIAQTRDNGVPAVVLHCAMHSFRKSSSDLGWLDRQRLERAQQRWADAYPGRPFPVWWQFTGVDSKDHDFARAMTLDKLAGPHPITAQLPDDISTPRDELYRNIALAENTLPLYQSYSRQTRGDHVVAWTNMVEGTRVFGTTLGHGDATYDVDDYYRLVANGVLWVTGRLGEDGWPKPGYEGTDVYRNYQDSLRCRPSDILEASTVAEVQAAVRATAAERKSLKVVSLDKSNSNSDIICPEQGGRILNLSGMNQILDIDRDAMEVTVEPGVRLTDLSATLADEGLAIVTMPDYTGVGVAGGIATAAHHSSLTIPVSLADQVREMKVVDGRGRLRVLRGRDLAAGAVHLGLLGVVVEVTLAVRPQYKLRYGYESGRDDDLADFLEARVRAHDYARVSWFAGNGRYVLEHYDEVDPSERGQSRHNTWTQTGGVFRWVGNLPYDIINSSPLRAQCDSAWLRSTIWLPSIDTVDSPRSAPVGWSHEMLGSYCEPGTCPWDADGVKSRTMEVAFPLRHLGPWMADVRAILGANRACFPLLGIYMRFSPGSDRALAFNHGEDVVAFEIHVPKVANEDAYEQSAATYDEIIQMTLGKYAGRPHWGKNSLPVFSGLGRRQFPAWNAFASLKRQLDPAGMFENRFWRIVTGAESVEPFPGCVLARACTCETDAHCGEGYACVAGGSYEPARVCRPKRR